MIAQNHLSNISHTSESPEGHFKRPSLFDSDLGKVGPRICICNRFLCDADVPGLEFHFEYHHSKSCLVLSLFHMQTVTFLPLTLWTLTTLK